MQSCENVKWFFIFFRNYRFFSLFKKGGFFKFLEVSIFEVFSSIYQYFSVDGSFEFLWRRDFRDYSKVMGFVLIEVLSGFEVVKNKVLLYNI